MGIKCDALRQIEQIYVRSVLTHVLTAYNLNTPPNNGEKTIHSKDVKQELREVPDLGVAFLISTNVCETNIYHNCQHNRLHLMWITNWQPCDSFLSN